MSGIDLGSVSHFARVPVKSHRRHGSRARRGVLVRDPGHQDSLLLTSVPSQAQTGSAELNRAQPGTPSPARSRARWGKGGEVVQGGARWCKVERGGARWGKVRQGGARWGRVGRGGARWAADERGAARWGVAGRSAVRWGGGSRGACPGFAGHGPACRQGCAGHVRGLATEA